MGRPGALAILVALGASSCTCAPTAEPARAPEAAPRPPGLRGRVAAAARNADGTSRALEIRVVPEAAMMELVSIRLLEARRALARTARARSQARQEATVALAEADRTNQAWKATTDSDLYRRLEVQLRRPRDPREVTAVHEDLLSRKKASYGRATEAARRSAEKERACDELERDARPYREARFYAQGLAPVVQATRTDGSGNFELGLPTGRYALVALTDPAPASGAPDASWLLWVEVREGAPAPILLDERNRHGTDCQACVVIAKDLP